MEMTPTVDLYAKGSRHFTFGRWRRFMTKSKSLSRTKYMRLPGFVQTAVSRLNTHWAQLLLRGDEAHGGKGMYI